jgi:Domain of Unknown Function (DUF1206)
MPDWLARLGLLARGAVYAVIGVLAIQVALGDGGKTVNQQGALKTVAKEPAGKWLLIALAVGLAGYALWRLTSAYTGRGANGFKERISAVVSGIAYGALCFTAIKIVVGAGSGSGSADKATGGVLGMDGGREAVGIVGAIIVFEGLAQLARGVKRSFLKKSRTEIMGEATEKVFTVTGAIGYCARGIVFGLIGAFLIKAAVEYDPKEAIALDGALAKVAHATAGPILLGVVSAGLIAFAAYCVADARYRRLET